LLLDKPDLSEKTRSRRDFLKLTGSAACTALLPGGAKSGLATMLPDLGASGQSAPDHSLRIAASPVEIAPKHIVSTITYNGQFPGPLLRFKEGQPVTVDIHNDTDAPEQLHWHGQMVSTEVDGAAEEGTPFVPARGMRRVSFTPRIFAGVPTSTSDNTAGRSVEFTSNLRASRETMTARSFSFSKNLNHRSVKAGTWLRIFLFLSCGSKNWKRAANLR
jgi:hypothetical protein